LGYDLRGNARVPCPLARAFYAVQQRIMVEYWWQRRSRIDPLLRKVREAMRPRKAEPTVAANRG
jgi:hypothetical protein